MNEKRSIKRLICAFLILTLVFIGFTCFVSCGEAGSETIHPKDKLRENLSSSSDKGDDYVWEYLDDWDFPKFSSDKLKNIEYRFRESYYKELPSSYSLAKKCAAAFLDEYYDNIDLSNVTEVTNALAAAYVDSIGDPHSTYRTPPEYNDYQQGLAGTTIGIGITVTYSEANDAIYVVSVSEGGGAHAAGVLAGDLITAVDGYAVSEVGYSAATAKIKGTSGTYAALSILRGEESLQLKARRGVIEVKSVEYSLENGIGYIKITGFKKNTFSFFKEAIDYMKQNGALGIIYDLRSNTGGLLSAVSDMLEYLAPKGTTLVSYSEKYGKAPAIDASEHAYTPPAVILTDYNTASASEIFVSDLCDLANMGHGTVVTVGQTTRGKGIMQSTYTFDDGSSVTLTVSYYYSTLGNNYHGVGIKPDVEVKGDALQLQTAYEEIEKIINR